MPDDQLNRVVYRAFQNAEAYLSDMYGTYRHLYDLPEFTHCEHVNDPQLFKYCLDRKYFLQILPYTRDQRVLLSPAFSGNQLTWRIVGGGVRNSLEESYVTACERHIERYVPHVRLGEIEPIAFVTNNFEFEDKRHSHFGVVFIARIRNPQDKRVIDNLSTTRGHFVYTGLSEPGLGQIYQQDVFRVAKRKIEAALLFSSQDHEIETNATYRGRYVFHDTMVKPVMRLASRLPLYDYSIPALDAQVRKMVLQDGTSSVLDVACGENLGLINLAIKDEVRLVVGNDISWSQIELMQKSASSERFRGSNSFVLFTNHDARRLPFRDKSFDCVICKNVLHHMPDQSSVSGLLSELRRVAKRSVIVEVRDPKYEGRWGRLRHRYYIDFLKDAGGNFLSKEEFSQLTAHPEQTTSMEMSTVRGVYMICQYGV